MEAGPVFPDFGTFLRDSFAQAFWIYGGVAVVITGLVESLLQRKLRVTYTLIVLAICIVLGFYFAWDAQYTALNEFERSVAEHSPNGSIIVDEKYRSNSPYPGTAVVAVLGIRNPGDPTVFGSFTMSALVNGHPHSAIMLIIDQPVIYNQNGNLIIYIPGDSLIDRGQKVTPRGGELNGVLIGAFLGASPKDVDLSSVKVSFQDVNSRIYWTQGKPKHQGLGVIVPGVGHLARAVLKH